MKKLKLNARSVKDILSRDEMKKVFGGSGSGSGSGSGGNYGDDGGSGINCLGRNFYEGSDGCGYLVCIGYNPLGGCLCYKDIQNQQPCGYA